MNINSVAIKMKRCIKSIKTFQAVDEEWLEFKIMNSFKDEPCCGVIQLAKKCLNHDIYPNIGLIPFNEIKRYDLVKIIKNIEFRNVKEPVKKAYNYLNQIYDYAVARLSNRCSLPILLLLIYERNLRLKIAKF